MASRLENGITHIRIDERRRAALDKRCDNLVHRALSDHTSFHRQNEPGRWRHIKQRPTMSVYSDRTRRSAAEEDAGKRTLMCSGLAPGSIEEILVGLYADTTDSYLVAKTIFFGDVILDASVLHTFQKGSLLSPVIYSGIKYMVHKAPILTSDRDQVVYERLGWVQDEYSQSFAYLSMQSVDLPEVPVTARAERLNVSACVLFRRIGGNCVGIFTIMDLDLQGMMLGPVAEYIIASRVVEYRRAIICARARAYSRLITQNASTTPSKSDWCDLCKAPRRLFRKKHKECRGCRQKVCKKCRERCVVFQLGYRTRKPVLETFCMKCIENVETQHHELARAPSRVFQMEPSSSSSPSSPSSKCTPSSLYLEPEKEPNQPPALSNVSSLSMGLPREDSLETETKNEWAVDRDAEDLSRMWQTDLEDSMPVWNEEELERLSKSLSQPWADDDTVSSLSLTSRGDRKPAIDMEKLD